MAIAFTLSSKGTYVLVRTKLARADELNEARQPVSFYLNYFFDLHRSFELMYDARDF